MNLPITDIKVGIDFGKGIDPVGRLVSSRGIIYFEYHEEHIQKGIQISPFRLPLKNGVAELPLRPFEGLAGVFSDSLPDGWGRLLFDRMLRAQGIVPSTITPLDRLAYVGTYGMGALMYEPDNSPSEGDITIDLDQLAIQSRAVLEGSSEEVINELLALNGSSAGARPKALIGVDKSRKRILYGAKHLSPDFDPWIVKFPNFHDGPDAGAIEYVYAMMAKEAGVAMPEVFLFPSNRGGGYFAVQRFDREGTKRLHMHTASGLLHSDFRTPALDYEDLLNLTGALTRDIREVEKIYRLAVFNVLAHNRDDHAKNFSFLMDESGSWRFAPAYDLTFSGGPNGEQSCTILGEGKNPTTKHLKKLGLEAKLSSEFVGDVIEQTKQAIGKWKSLAAEFQIAKSSFKLIEAALNKI
nr:type II toxin-antitoxin system HipA family toxin [Cytophagales bacterium]